MAKSAKADPGRASTGKNVSAKAKAVAQDDPEPKAAPESDPDPVLVYIAQVVLKARKKMGLTQLQLSRKAGCNSTAVFMVETARQNMTIKSLMQLAAALDLQIGDLFPRTAPGMTAKLKELAEALSDSGGRIAIQLRTIERIVGELNEEAASTVHQR
jgi:transcriptional regulator with XRE-family HTH domain